MQVVRYQLVTVAAINSQLTTCEVNIVARSYDKRKVHKWSVVAYLTNYCGVWEQGSEKNIWT
jgi:hypothetical protein